jgi:hypothetical protein
MRKTALIVVVVAPALVLTGCKSSTNKAKVVPPQVKISALATPASASPAPATTTPASATPTPIPPPAPASSASPTPTPSATAPASLTGSAPTDLDPCQLVTQDEASTIAGATFGAGEEQKTAGGGKICVYGSETTNVFTVEVAQAEPALASAEWTQELAETEATIESRLPPGVHVNFDASNAAGIGDEAAVLTGSETLVGKPINFSGIYVLSGGTFFLIGDLVLGKASPPVSAMEDQARKVLTRI